jgi:hypothetical protein
MCEGEQCKCDVSSESGTETRVCDVAVAVQFVYGCCSSRVYRSGVELWCDDNVLRVNQVLFADDTALVAKTESELRVLVRKFGRVCNIRKLCVNVGKSKVMRCARDANVGSLDVRLNGERLKEVDKFKYLGSHVSCDCDVVKEVVHRAQEGAKVLGAVGRVM